MWWLAWYTSVLVKKRVVLHKFLRERTRALRKSAARRDALSRRQQRADVEISVASWKTSRRIARRNHRHRILAFSCKFAPLQPRSRFFPPLLRRVVRFCLRVLNSRRVAPRRPSPIVVVVATAASFVCLLVRANG